MNDALDWKQLGYHRRPRQALELLLSRAPERRRLRLALEARGLPIPPEVAKRPPGPRRRPRAEPPPLVERIVDQRSGAETIAERRKRFMGRHHVSAPKPTHTGAGLPLYEERRLRRLLRATDHVAPRFQVQRLEQSNRLRDARAVVKMYISGVSVKILGGDLLRRLATDGYGKGLRPIARVLTAALLAFALHPSALAASPAPDCRARPAWCPDGYTCEPTSCTARATVALEGLGAQLVAARAERPRWFRPFLEAGATWSVLDQAPGVYGEGGVILWRHVNLSAEVTQYDARAKIGWRREW